MKFYFGDNVRITKTGEIAMVLGCTRRGLYVLDGKYPSFTEEELELIEEGNF